MREKYPTLEFDRLKIYFGEPLIIPCRHGEVTVLSPTIGDIIALGEAKFYSTLNIFVANTTSYRAFLWDLQMDWNEVSDFELFCIIYKQIDPDVSKLLFSDLDFSLFEVKILNVDENIRKLVLVNVEQNVEIDEDVYQQIHQYLQIMFGMHPEELLTTEDRMKRWWIAKDKREQERKAKKKDEKKYSIQPTVSALVNHPGFKYKLKELKEVGVAEFYDSVQRLQIYEQSTALMKGLYSGMISGKDVKPEQYNFMREI